MAYLHDQVAIKQVLAHLGLSPPEEPIPPPAVDEVVRVPVAEAGGGTLRAAKAARLPLTTSPYGE